MWLTSAVRITAISNTTWPKAGQAPGGFDDQAVHLYLAIAHLGYDPCTLVPNLPVTIETDNGTIWQPKEAGRVEYTGELKPLWWGLANSRNNYSAWIMKQARQPQAVADYIHKMGIKSYIDPVYSLCLGTPDFSLFELVGATGHLQTGAYLPILFS